MIDAYQLISLSKDPMIDLNVATVHTHLYLVTWEYLSMHGVDILNLSHIYQLRMVRKLTNKFITSMLHLDKSMDCVNDGLLSICMEIVWC